MSKIEVGCPRCEDADIKIEYTISGRFIPASFSSPAEYPDLEIETVYAEECDCWAGTDCVPTSDEEEEFGERIAEDEASYEPDEDELWEARGF